MWMNLHLNTKCEIQINNTKKPKFIISLSDNLPQMQHRKLPLSVLMLKHESFTTKIPDLLIVFEYTPFISNYSNYHIVYPIFNT